MTERSPGSPRIGVREAQTQADMQAVMAIRHRVFVVEQGVTTNVGGDPNDRDAWHLLGIVDGQVAGIGRLHITAGEGQIAWVAVVPEYRRHGVGRAIMRRLLELADEADVPVVLLNAQTHALRFYQHLGFETIGETFIMGGIEHQLMARGHPDWR